MKTFEEIYQIKERNSSDIITDKEILEIFK